MNAFANWLDNDANFYLFIGSLLVAGAVLKWAVKHFRSEPPSRGEEAGVPERDDEMAVAHVARVEPEAGDWDLWEEQFYSLAPLVERVKRVKEGRR